MTKLTLMVEGSASVIAAILAALPDGANVTVPPMPAPAGLPGGGQSIANEPGDETGDTAAPDGAVDANGITHDKRIHSDTPTLTTKNEWRRRRGVSDELVAQVEAEQRAAKAAQPMPPLPPVPLNPVPLAAPAAVAPPLPDPAALTPPPVAPPVPLPVPPVPAMPDPAALTPPPVAPVPEPAPTPAPVAAAPVASPVAVTDAGAPVVDFGTFMTKLAGGMQKDNGTGGKLVSTEYVASLTQQLAAAFGITLNVITDVMPASVSDPRIVPYAIQLLQRDGIWQHINN